MVVSLRKIDEANFYDVLKLKVREDQQEYVARNIFSLAQAWLYYEEARPFAIYADETPVGFFMASVNKDKPEFGIWRFMIDEKYQGKGYGHAALKLAICYLKKQGAKEIVLSYEPENKNAALLYEKEGFVLTGEIDEGELVAKLKL